MFTMIVLPHGLWIDVVSHLWQTTIVLAVLALLAGAMRRAPARLLNILWWIGLAKLLVPVQLVAPLVRRVTDPIAGEVAAGVHIPGVAVWLHRAAPVFDPAAGRQAGWAGAGFLGAALVLLWIAGAVWLAASLVRARRAGTIGQAVSCDGLPPGLRTRLGAAIEGTGVPASAIRVTRASVMPATIGIARRAIVVPEVLITRLETPELRAVLLHEDAHRRRLDPLQGAVRRAAAVAFYFFPPLWPLLARLRETGEMACDEAVIRRGVAPFDYARALARTMSIGLEPHGFAAALARGTPSLTRRRFARLTDEGRFVLMKRHWLCLAIAAFAVVGVSATGLALLADRGLPIGGSPSGFVTKEDKKAAKTFVKRETKQLAKAVARGVALVVAPDMRGAPTAVQAAVSAAVEAGVEGAVAANERAAAEKEAAEAEVQAVAEALAAESEALEKDAEESRAAAESLENEAEAAQEAQAAVEEAMARAEAAAGEEADAEAKTYTVTLEEIVDPEYPEDAKEDGVGGRVTLELTLTPDGEVGSVVTLVGVEGYPSLSDAAEVAAHKWIFHIVGEPEEDIEVIVPVEFKLEDEKTLEMSVTEPDAGEAPKPPDEPTPPEVPEPESPPAAEEMPEPAGQGSI